MDVEFNAPNLYVVLANYDLRQIRVQKNFLEEQCTFINCTGFCSGRELIEKLWQGMRCDVVVLGSQLDDMDEAEFITQLRRLVSRPLLLQFGESRHSESTASCLRADGNSYIARETELKNLLEELYKAAGRRSIKIETLCLRLYAEWGIRQPDTNCGYLTSALRTACASSGKLAIRKQLLQRVSEEHHVSIAAVDSGLRRLVDECEAQGSEGWLEFKRASGFAGKKFTTGKLIYAARERLLLYGLPGQEWRGPIPNAAKPKHTEMGTTGIPSEGI